MLMKKVWLILLVTALVTCFFAACSGGSSSNIKKWTVTFDKNGGDTEAAPKTKTITSPATTIDALPAAPTRTGYTFSGWNTEADGSGAAFTASTPVTDDITVYAQWSQSGTTVTVTVGDTTQNVTVIPGDNGTIAYLPDNNGYTYTYGTGSNSDYGNAIVRFKVNLGTKTLGDFWKVKLKWTGVSGGAASYKNLSLLATNTEADITPYKGDDAINALIVSNNTAYDNGAPVNGTDVSPITLDITKGSALSGDVWFSFYEHATEGAYTISDVTFELRPPPSGASQINVVFGSGAGQTEVKPGNNGSIEYLANNTGYTFTYGTVADSGYGNGIVRFMIDLGTNTLGDYIKVTFTWTGVSGDAISYKNLSLLATNTEADITPWKNDDSINALIVSENSAMNNGTQVNGTSATPVNLNITKGSALTGSVWFSIYMHASAGKYTISNVTFEPK